MARAERPRDLNGHRRLGQVDREVGHLRDDEHLHLAVAERLVEALPLIDGCRARQLRSVEAFGQLVDLIEILTDDQDLLAVVFVDELPDHVELDRRCRSEAITLVVGGGRVLEPRH